MKETNLPNIAVSGWFGAGSTSLTLMLAWLFKFKLYPVTKVFRLLDQKLGFSKAGVALRKEFESEVQPKVGKTVDNYSDYKLMNLNGIILESDIAAFRIGNHPKVFSLFLQTNIEVRRERVKLEGREKAETAIGRRDSILKQVYLDLWNIDIFDEELIKRKYSLVINNSKMTFIDEINVIIETLANDQIYKNAQDWNKFIPKVTKTVKLFQEIGKAGMLKKLESKKLVASPEEMMQEITMLYPEEIITLPETIQKIFLGQK
ncbi:MAG: cytidylate kinase family protein [bacterium]